MAQDNFQLIIEAAIAKAKSDANIKKYVKEIQSQIKDLEVDVKVSDANVKTAIKEVNKLTQEGSAQNIKARQEELRLQKMIFNEEQLNIKKNLADKQNALKFSNQSIKEEVTNRKNALNLQKLQVQEDKLRQNELLKTAKISQNALNLKSGKIVLGNNISTFLRENSKLSDVLRKKLILIQKEIDSVGDANGLKNLRSRFQEVSSEASALGLKGKNVFDQFKTNIGQFLNFFYGAGSVVAVIGSLRTVVENVYQIDTAMTSLKKVTNESAITYNNFMDEAANRAEKLATSVATYINQTAEWSKAGYGLKDSANLAEVSSLFENVGDVNAEQSVKDIVTPLKAFNIEAKNAISIVDKLNQVDNEFSVSSADLGEGLKNSASALALAGNDINQSIAMITGGSEIECVSPYVEIYMLCA